MSVMQGSQRHSFSQRKTNSHYLSDDIYGFPSAVKSDEVSVKAAKGKAWLLCRALAKGIIMS